MATAQKFSAARRLPFARFAVLIASSRVTLRGNGSRIDVTPVDTASAHPLQ